MMTDQIEGIDELAAVRVRTEELAATIDALTDEVKRLKIQVSAVLMDNDRLSMERDALEARIEKAVNLFKDFAAHNDAESIGNVALWNGVLSALNGDEDL